MLNQEDLASSVSDHLIASASASLMPISKPMDIYEIAHKMDLT
jgi:hypothetical protein